MSNARCKNTESVRDHFSLEMTQAHPSRGLDGPDRMSIHLRVDSDDGAARAWSDWSPSAATDDSSASDEPSTLALDMVDRFLDVMRVERFAAGATLREYRSHLHAAESWLRRFAGWPLVPRPRLRSAGLRRAGSISGCTTFTRVRTIRWPTPA